MTTQTYTAQNAIQDNLKQLMVALDKSEQEWSKLALEAGKEQQPMPTKTNIDALYAKAQGLVADVMAYNRCEHTDASNLATPTRSPTNGSCLEY